MRRRFSLVALALLAVGAGLLWAEVKTTDPMTLQVREIGKNLKCQCGCAYTVADCNMLYCHFRDPINQDIEEGLKAGLTTESILSKIYAKYGEFVRTEPVAVGFGTLGWVMPFAALGLGLAIAPLVVRRWKRKTEAAETAKPAKSDPPQAAIRRMEAQIEKDLADEE